MPVDNELRLNRRACGYTIDIWDEESRSWGIVRYCGDAESVASNEAFVERKNIELLVKTEPVVAN